MPDGTATVLAAAAFVISILVGLLTTVSKSALGGREKEVDRRLNDTEKANAELRGDLKLHAAETRTKAEKHDERLHGVEVETEKQNGEIGRLKDKHDVFIEDIHEIKRSISSLATKAELQSMERMIERGFNDLRGTRGQYVARPTPGPIPRVDRDETTNPPPRERGR